jgi:hypothetical protein
MFHHGYLSCDRYVPSMKKHNQTLFFPNLEVKSTLLPTLLQLPKPKSDPYDIFLIAKSFYSSIVAQDPDSFAESFYEALCAFPAKTSQEKFPYYHSVISLLLSYMGIGQKLSIDLSSVKKPINPPFGPLFDFAIEIDSDSVQDDECEASFVVFKYKNLSKHEAEKVFRDAVPKTKIQKFVKNNYTEKTSDRKIKISACVLSYHKDRDGFEAKFSDL